MKSRSCKAKGRIAQQSVRDALRARFNALQPGDIESRQMGGSGTDIILSPVAKMMIPFDIEVKCQENLNVWAALAQAKANTEEGRVPLLCFKRNRTEMYCALPLSDLLRLL